MSDSYIIAGLGNPGDKYQNTRHNVGFMAIDAIAERHRFPPFLQKFKGMYSSGQIGGHRVHLLKPMTYMNHSGVCVSMALKFFKIPPGNLYVIMDDLDIKNAKLKMKLGGGSGGHNGIRSIDQLAGSEYHRVRIGIDHPRALSLRQPVDKYVLSGFTDEQKSDIDMLLDNIAREIPLMISGDKSVFINKTSNIA